MRFPLGFGILLVLILGLICVVSPINSYEGSQEDESSTPAQTVQPENVNSPDEKNDQSPPHLSRRAMGMPALTSSREMSGVPGEISTIINQQDPAISSPINEPGTKVLSDLAVGEVISLKKNEQEMINQDMKSQARGLDVMSTFGNNPASFQQQTQQPGSGQLAAPPVRQEDLPTIIENNRPVSPGQPPNNPQQQQQPQSQQIESSTSVGVAAPQQLSAGNSSQLMSSARTMESWTSCVGQSSNKYGTCKNDVECNKKKGRADGSCMGGLGVCCVMALSCGDKSSENNTFFANPDFPESSWEARLCEVEVKKKSSNILQVMIEFEEFEMAPPNPDGECITDVFTIKLASNRPSPYSLLRICGQNTGQHMYLDVSQLDEPLVLSVATSGGGFPRRWSIRIVQMDEKNHLLAPPGCLQYYTDTVGHFRSFNLGRNLKYLYYAICFRIDNGYSGIRFTENFFGMNGPGCRRRLTGSNGRLNTTFGAHPHHLVIPPPGLGHPLPPFRGGPTPLPQGHEHPGKFHPGHGRFKRLAYSEPLNERTTRTLSHEHEQKFADMEFKHEGQYGPPTYGPPPVYGQQQQLPPPNYGGYQSEYPYKGDVKGEWKGDHKEAKHPHEHEMSNLWQWDKWGETLGWKSESKEQKHAEHGGYPPNYYGPSPQGNYGPPSYGPPSYGPPSYGPPVYGPQAYRPPAYGNYHHKEIDKFGKKYEHLEYKHEKNHHEMEAEKSKSWWPSWGTKKEEKKDKKDKFNTHHEALFPMIRMQEMPQCEPKFCGQNDVITFPPSGESISEMCGNKFNRGRGPKIISGSPLVVYVSNRGHNRGAGFDMNYEQVFFIPNRY